MKITMACRSDREDDTVNEATGGRWRWYRARPRRAGILAVTVGIVLLAAACGGGASAGSGASSSTSASSTTDVSSTTGGTSTTGGATLGQQDLAFAQCMRSDSVTDFPDPGSSGQFPKISAQMEDSPQFGKGFNACKHLLPAGGVPKGQQDASGLLKFAQCMHAHGVPSYPEQPGPVSPYSVLASNTAVNALQEAGVNPNSPVVQAALRTCEGQNPVSS